MKDYIIITDACSDLDKGLREELGVDYIKMTLVYGDKEMPCSLDWENISPEDFYQQMRDGVPFKTAQINIEQYVEAFTPYLEKGLDIFCVVTSSGLSGSINSALMAKKQLAEKYPDAKIYCMDSLRGSLGQGMLVYYSVQKKKAGMDIDALAEWFDEFKTHVHQVGSVDDLKYLKRAGRVTGMAALMGDIFKVKPLIISNAKGENESIQKVIGRAKSLKRIVEYTVEHIENPEEQLLFICHADCRAEADELRETLIKTVKCKDVHINWVGPVIGATVGPGMIGVYFCGDKVIN